MSTLTLRPNADSHKGLTSSAGADHYATVDETSLDEADYVLVDGGVGTQALFDDFGYPNHSTESETINSVTVKAYCKKVVTGTDADNVTVRLLVSIGGTQYYGNAQNLTSSTALYTKAWTTNPATSSAWSWTNIDDLIAGLELTSHRTDKNNNVDAICYQLWVEVAYGEAGSVYEKACSVGMNFTPSDSEIANFPAAASVGMNLSASDSEVAAFVRSALINMNLSASDIESADFVKAATAAIAIAQVLGGTTANIYNVAATVAMTLGVSTSEVADFIAVAQIALGLGINDGETASINKTASLGMLLSVGNSEVAAFNIEAAEGISLQALASEIGAYIETLSAEFTITQDVQATIEAAEEFLKSLTAVLNISVSASASVPVVGGIAVSAVSGFTMAVLAAASLLYSVSAVTYAAGDLKVSLVFNGNKIGLGFTNSRIKYVN